MSEMAKSARAANKAKAKRMSSGDPHAKVDASDWTPPEQLNTEAKTGLRPVSRRAFKSGGKVDGAETKKHAGRKARKSGGNVANEIVNRNVKEANEEKFGKTHTGGMKRGGKADGVYEGTRPTGGRKARKDGGRAKGKTNINIIINSKGDKPEMPMGGLPAMPPPPVPPKVAMPPGPPPGGPMGGPPPGPPPMGPGAPMMRKSGGRANPRTTGYMQMEAGAGSALGRLQKAHGKKP